MIPREVLAETSLFFRTHYETRIGTKETSNDVSEVTTNLSDAGLRKLGEILRNREPTDLLGHEDEQVSDFCEIYRLCDYFQISSWTGSMVSLLRRRAPHANLLSKQTVRDLERTFHHTPIRWGRVVVSYSHDDARKTPLRFELNGPETFQDLRVSHVVLACLVRFEHQLSSTRSCDVSLRFQDDVRGGEEDLHGDRSLYDSLPFKLKLSETTLPTYNLHMNFMRPKGQMKYARFNEFEIMCALDEDLSEDGDLSQKMRSDSDSEMSLYHSTSATQCKVILRIVAHLAKQLKSSATALKNNDFRLEWDRSPESRKFVVYDLRAAQRAEFECPSFGGPIDLPIVCPLVRCLFLGFSGGEWSLETEDKIPPKVTFRVRWIRVHPALLRNSGQSRLL